MTAVQIFFFISTILIFSLVESDGINSRFAKEYFLDKNVKQTVVFACWNYFEILNFFRPMMDSDFKVSYFNILENVDMKLALQVNYYKLGIFLDLDCPRGEDFLNQFASKYKLPFNESYFWLAITKSDEIPLEILRNLPLTVASELTVALREKNTFVMYDVYNPSYRHGGKINVTHMGFWNETIGLNSFLNQYKYKRRADFHGLALNFSVYYTRKPEPDLETYMKTAINPHLDTVSRSHYELVRQLRDMYNFTIHMTRGESWGYEVNGTFNGIIGDMVAGIVDISASPFLYRSGRMHVCEWTVQTYRARATMFFRHPQKNSIHNVFLKPFNQNVWWAIAIFGMFFWTLLLFMIKKEMNIKSESDFNSFYSNPTTGTALIVLAAITQQDASDVPHFYSGRLFCVSIFFWGLLLYQFYSASIVGELLAESPRFIHTVQDLLNSGLDIGIEDVVYHRSFLTTFSDDRCKAVLKRIDENTKKRKPSYFNISEGMRRMKNGGFAFLVDIATAYRLIEESFTDDEICDLKEIDVYTLPELGLITSKNSPFKKMVTYGLRQSVTSGSIKHLRTRWFHRKPHCPEGYSSLPTPVHFHEFTPALFLLLAGTSLAVMIWLIEKFLHRTFPLRLEDVIWES